MMAFEVSSNGDSLVRFWSKNPIAGFEAEIDTGMNWLVKKCMIIINYYVICLTLGFSPCNLLSCFLPNMTVLSGRVSSLVMWHMAPITQPLHKAVILPKYAENLCFSYI